MSLARALPFNPAIDTLIAYGRLRQQDAEQQALFLRDATVSLPELFRPGVLADLAVLLDADTLALSLVQAQRRHDLLNQLVWELCSGTLLRTLEALTGLQHLLPDPYFSLGGWWHQLRQPATETHPLWQLPVVLGLDICLHGESRLPSPAGQAAPLLAGQARLWSAGRVPDWEPALENAVGIRVLCFHGPTQPSPVQLAS